MLDFRKAIVKGQELLQKVLNDYADTAKNAYLNTDGDFKINLGLKFTSETDKIKVEAEIGFVESKIKDSAIGYVSDQQQLPLKNTVGQVEGVKNKHLRP